ncbi:L-aspartate 1-decarboxylase [Maridesulfovibrio ferrireducens]|uniref:Aspartate 1-decarboxylase n=1 Tax=Maridesulfovibrio ferrireducens TaxID=246191 RepID=A0A1G9E6M9_9BACT|nr:aspartate 1-decarboxylase [Maridesulfovibrio ferrireducens]SDK71738.1 L-aspartate 1-decarboxylase [Maridesulfovibrio ferrireducens]
MGSRCLLKSKIHRATITDANVDYEGSISIDVNLLEKSGILPYERVDVLNVDNGERLTTYAIEGGEGEFCLNGAAAHKGQAGQRIIICTYTWLDDDELGLHKPNVLLLGDGNRIKLVQK